MSSSRSEVRDPDTYCDVCGIQFLQRDTYIGHKRFYCGNARRSRAESALADIAGAASAPAARDPSASAASSVDGPQSHPQSPHSSKSSHTPPHVLLPAAGPVKEGGSCAASGSGAASQQPSQGQTPPAGPAAPPLDYLNPLLLMQSVAQTLYAQSRPQQLLEPPAAAGETPSPSATLEQLSAFSEHLKQQLHLQTSAAAAPDDAHLLPATAALASGGGPPPGAGNPYQGVFLPGAPLVLAAPMLTAFGFQYYPVMQTPLTLCSLIGALDSQPPQSPGLPPPLPAAGARPGPLSASAGPSRHSPASRPQSRRSESPAPPPPASQPQPAADPLQQLLQSFRALEPLNALFSAAAAAGGLAAKASPTSTSLASSESSAAAGISQELLDNYVSQHLRSHPEPQPQALHIKASASPPPPTQQSSGSASASTSATNRPLDLTLKLKPQQQQPVSAAAAAEAAGAHQRCSHSGASASASSECSDVKPALGGGTAAPDANLVELLRLYQTWLASTSSSNPSTSTSTSLLTEACASVGAAGGGGGLPLLWSSQAARANEQLLALQAAAAGSASDAAAAGAGGEVLPVLLQNSVFFMCTRCLVAFRDLELLRVHKPQCTGAEAAVGGKSGASGGAAVVPAPAGATGELVRPAENREAARRDGAGASLSPKQQQQNFSCVCGIQFSAADSLRAHQTWYCSKTAALDKEAAAAANAGLAVPSRHVRSRSEVRASGAFHELQQRQHATAADEANSSAPLRRHGVSFMETVARRRELEDRANGALKEEPLQSASGGPAEAEAQAEVEAVELVPVKLFTCGVCAHSSRSLESFAEHIKCHPTIAQAVYYQCALCGYRGNTVRGLKIHGKAHCAAGGANFGDDQVQLMCRPDAIAGGVAAAAAVPKEILQVSTRLVRAAELEHRADGTAVGGTTRERDGSFGELQSPGGEHQPHAHPTHRTRSRRSYTDAAHVHVLRSDAAAAHHLAAAAYASGAASGPPSDGLECPHCHSGFTSAPNRLNHERNVCGRFKRAMTVADNNNGRDSCCQQQQQRKRTHTATTTTNHVADEALDEAAHTNPNPFGQLPEPQPKEAPAASTTSTATPTGNSASDSEKALTLAATSALKVCSRCGASFRNLSNYLAHKQFYCHSRRQAALAAHPHQTSSFCATGAADEEAECCSEAQARQRQAPPHQRSSSECLVSPSASEPSAAVGGPIGKRLPRAPNSNECADDRERCSVRMRLLEVVAIEAEAAADADEVCAPPPPKRALQQQRQREEADADESGVWPRDTRESSTSSASEERDSSEQRAARSPAHESVVDVCG